MHVLAAQGSSILNQQANGMDEKTISFDDLRGRINQAYDALSPQLQRVARYALHSPNRLALQTVQEVYQETGVQPSSIVRFAQTFGFKGYSDFQKVFRHRLIEGTPDLREAIYQQKPFLEGIAEDDPLHLLNDFSQASIDAIDGMRKSVRNETLREAIDMIDAAETVYVLGQRRAFPVASYIAYGLARLERKVCFIDFVGGMASQQAATISANDLLIAVSFPEYAESVVDIVRNVAIRGEKMLAITDAAHSPLSKCATLAFHISDDSIRRFRPLSPSMVLAQVLILALSYREA